MFGRSTRNLLKRLTKTEIRYTRLRLQNEFLKNCLSKDIIPKHIAKSKIEIRLESSSSINALNKHWHIHSRNVLKVEIRDNYRRLRILHGETVTLNRSVYKYIPEHFLYRFFIIQDNRLWNITQTLRAKLRCKFNRLVEERLINSRRKLQPFEYYCQLPKTSKDLSVNQQIDANHMINYSKTDNSLSDNNAIIHVKLGPAKYDNVQAPSLLATNDRWFINLSSTDIPPSVKGFLKLGKNLCLPPSNALVTSFEIVKHVESGLRTLPVEFHQIVV